MSKKLTRRVREETKPQYVDLPKEVADKVRDKAEELEVSQVFLIQKMLERYFTKAKKKKFFSGAKREIQRKDSLTFRLPKSLIEEIDREVKKEGIKKSAFYEGVFSDYIEEDYDF